MSESTLAASGGRVPIHHEDIKDVFKEHYDYYRNEDGEIAHQQQSGESAIRRAYSGRMVFELLQNAIDRAEDCVEVRFRATDDKECAYQLIVANDGASVRVDPGYPYDDPPDARDGTAQRPDFNALCSLHTSNKSQDESIGTKGSGFRSVFSIDTYVRVWSRFENREDWWGLEMHSPMDRTIWADRQDDPDVRRGTEAYLSTVDLPPMDGAEERPSYHFPLPLSADTPLSMLAHNESLSTGVIVPIPEDDKSNIESSFDQLKSHHLYFTGLAEGNEEISVEFDILGEYLTRETTPPEFEGSSGEGLWSISDWCIDDASSELAERAQTADLDITYPGAAIAWPPRHPNHESSDGDPEEIQPAVYGYLPTVIDGPFGADLHGDFKLSIDRTNIRFDDNIIGPYNRQIAQIGAELHVLMAVRGVPELIEAIDWEFIEPAEVNHSALTSQFDRNDYWRFLNPDNATSKADDIVEKHVADLLFDADTGKKDPKKYRLWAKLTSEFFDQSDEWPIETYDSFWKTNLQWVDYIYNGKTRGTNWRRIAKAMCDAFREANAAVAPIVEGNNAETAEAKSLPPSRDVGGSTARKERELYIWNPNREQFDLSNQFDLPQLLKNDDRIVTTYDFNNNIYTNAPNPLGATEFTRWEVLNELRQLPNSLNRVDEFGSRSFTVEDDSDIITQQCQLIRFAAQLYQLNTGGSQEIPAESDQYDPGWRMRDTFSDDAQRAGRSLATLFLPITAKGHEAEELWAPARQLTRDQVAVERIRNLPDEIDVDAFLGFLGVAPTPPDNDGVPLTLVEGGDDGCVDPQETPPPLTAAERGPPDATLAELRRANRPVSNPHAWCQSIQAAYDEWLEPLIRIEHEVAALGAADDSDADGRDCWTNIVETVGEWPWYPVDASEESDGATPPTIGYTDATAVRPTQITVHDARQTQFPKLLYAVEDSADPAQLLVALGAIDGLDPEELRSDAAEQAYRLLSSIEDLPSAEIADPRLQRTLIDLYTRLLESIVRGDPEARHRDQLSLLMYKAGEDGMALSERRLTWTHSFEDAWIAKDRSEQRTIHQYFPTIPLVAATVAPRHIEAYEPLADREITLTESVRMKPSEGISNEITDNLFNLFGNLVPRLLALADATSTSSIDHSNLTENWGPDRFGRAENVWREITVEFDEESRTSRDLEDTQGIVLVTSEEPRQIVFDTPDDAEHPSLHEFGEALAEFLVDHSVSDLFARALRMAEDGDARLNKFLEDRDATSLVPTYRNEFDPLSSEEHEILVDETRGVLNKVGVSLATTAASQLRILRPDDIKVPERRETDPDEMLTQSYINEVLQAIDLPDSRDWEGYRPQFRCTASHYNKWETWFDHRETYLLPYLLDFLEQEGIAEYSDELLRDALDTYARTEVCPRITFQPEQVIPSWLATQGITDVPDSGELLEQAKRFESSFDPVTEVKDMTDMGITPGEIEDVSIDPEGNESIVTPEEATRTKRAQMAYGQDAEQAALDKIVGTTTNALEKVWEDGDLRTVFGDTITHLHDAVNVLCWPFYDGGVTDTHVREHMDMYESDADIDALRNALHVSTVWDGAGFDIIGLGHYAGNLYPIRYEIKSLSDNGSSTIAHLTQKQYAVYKAVHNSEPSDRAVAGDWRLYGVTEKGIAVDITDWLDNLPDDALTSLREQGFEPDGLVLSTGNWTESESN